MMAVSPRGKNELHIPHKDWAMGDTADPKLDFENWKALERWAADLNPGLQPVIDMGDGAVLTGWSKAWYFGRATTFRAIVGVLSAADDANDIEATIARNGSSIGTATISSGKIIEENKGPFIFSAGDRWQMNVTTAAEDAVGLSWFGVF